MSTEEPKPNRDAVAGPLEVVLWGLFHVCSGWLSVTWALARSCVSRESRTLDVRPGPYTYLVTCMVAATAISLLAAGQDPLGVWRQTFETKGTIAWLILPMGVIYHAAATAVVASADSMRGTTKSGSASSLVAYAQGFGLLFLGVCGAGVGRLQLESATNALRGVVMIAGLGGANLATVVVLSRVVGAGAAVLGVFAGIATSVFAIGAVGFLLPPDLPFTGHFGVLGDRVLFTPCGELVTRKVVWRSAAVEAKARTLVPTSNTGHVLELAYGRIAGKILDRYDGDGPFRGTIRVDSIQTLSIPGSRDCPEAAAGAAD